MKEILNCKCRICGSKRLYEVITLEKMPLTDEFITQDDFGKEFLSDIVIGICSNCGITQNCNDLNMSLYYDKYEYSVGYSPLFNHFMEKLVEKTIKFFSKKNLQSVKVLEIGSGSGELLEKFKRCGVSVLGIEPSSSLCKFANKKGIPTLNSFFCYDMVENIPADFKTVDCIISCYTFDHLPDINDALQACRKILNKNGKLIIEIHDLDLIIKRKEFCLFEHEHYFYLNKETAEFVFNKNGFNIIDFNLLRNEERRANSLLIVAEPKYDDNYINLNLEIELKKVSGLKENITELINKIDAWLLNNSKYKIVAYGAGGRGVMTIAALKNYKYFNVIIDKNPKGDNIYLPKTHIPIKKPEFLINTRVDYIFVFSYGYFKEIIQELSKYGYSKKQFVSLLDFS
ncbi:MULTISPECIES: class I SAM-dependent methyltransferase [Thermodesulfovibrio]|jgi:SAM-dependent methyltransferase|uniref:Methyltransferase, putative n=1 Tax=Thermodesulfovibrio yellowstonii (strain ATCC 51303 / DSM 11347 / YP87) TaxID=289376 RepID=B5YGB6_THEYD|nr:MULTISPECIES: class I SAM-dependent methyltransferase [Thermodesulfovibrio]ACI20816.1 methyltransferase, putative [Thermodesulfovibrio yellowstonii DSM 11347]